MSAAPVLEKVRTNAESDPVAAALAEAWAALGVGPAEGGVVSGQLLRPRFAFEAVGSRGVSALGLPLQLAALAVQLAHEASLLHDDVVDGATVRRGRPTLAGEAGVGAALVAGDQLLARAYLAAAATGSWAFVHRFTRAIDATISGERAQARAIGRRPGDAEMRAIARGKSGELFGCAMAAGAALAGDPAEEPIADLGREIGVFYQRVDDLLDYCPSAATGKPPFADFGSDLWTWPRCFLPEGAEARAFFEEGQEGIPALRALARLEAEGQALRTRVERELPHASGIRGAIDGWLARASGAVRADLPRRAMALVPSGARPLAAAPPPGGSMNPAEVLSRHGRSFHFAARWMPAEVRDPVTRVYAFCRALDDAVDRAPNSVAAERDLEVLLARARRGWEDPEGEGSDDPLDRAMAEARAAGVEFDVIERLAAGVRMDLRPRTFRTFEELDLYTHRVAGVVGIWIAGLAGCRDPWALDLADRLGRAMQLTNIARDVGEDLRMGRMYLPVDLLSGHGLAREDLERIMRSGEAIPAPLAAALEEVMARADLGYAVAMHAIPSLPPGYRRAVAVAARVYQGIHREIRRNGYDTLRMRAHTGLGRKLLLGWSSLRELARAEARSDATGAPDADEGATSGSRADALPTSDPVRRRPAVGGPSEARYAG